MPLERVEALYGIERSTLEGRRRQGALLARCWGALLRACKEESPQGVEGSSLGRCQDTHRTGGQCPQEREGVPVSPDCSHVWGLCRLGKSRKPKSESAMLLVFRELLAYHQQFY